MTDQPDVDQRPAPSRPAGPTGRCIARSGSGAPFPLGATWDGAGHELLALLRARRGASICACSTTTAPRRGCGWPSARCTSGTATCPRSARASATATASSGPTSRRPGTASTPPSCCSTPTRRRSTGASTGPPPTSCPTCPTPKTRTPTSSPTTRTRRRRCPAAWSSTSASTGARIASPAGRSRRRSSTRPTCRASRCVIPACARTCAAPTPGSRPRQRSRTCSTSA